MSHADTSEELLFDDLISLLDDSIEESFEENQIDYTDRSPSQASLSDHNTNGSPNDDNLSTVAVKCEQPSHVSSRSLKVSNKRPYYHKKEKMKLERMNLKVELGSKFLNFYASAVNNDFLSLPEKLFQISSQGLTVKTYILNNFQDKKEMTPALSMDLHHFISTIRRCQQVSPNAMLEIFSCDVKEGRHRNHSNDHNTVYIGKFRYSGTIVINDPIIAQYNYITVKDIFHSQYEKILGPDIKGNQWRNFEVIGSMTMHRKNNDPINKIEFFYKYTYP